jgi:hypothetical protein
MTTIEQREHGAGSVLRIGGWMLNGLTALIGLRTLGSQRVAPLARVETRTPSELFARALGENSNRAMDWLAYADELADADERRYCAGRALLIDPQCPIVRREATRLRWG